MKRRPEDPRIPHTPETNRGPNNRLDAIEIQQLAISLREEGDAIDLLALPARSKGLKLIYPVEPGIGAKVIGDTTSHPGPVNPRREKRVLLAEDVKINQVVAVHLLRQMGCEVDIANNGVEAVAAWRKTSYRAILMDFRMPEMDGSQATRLIRTLELRENRSPTPIIALTANSLEGDRELCLAAGMSDFVTKPIKKEALKAALEKAGSLV